MKSLLIALAKELDSRGIGYLVIGGQAVLLYGEPRFTKDIDLTLALEPDQLPLILDVAQALQIQPIPDDPRSFVQRTYVLPCLHESSTMGVDFIFSFSPYERTAIERGILHRIDDTDVRFATAEDLIIQKLVAGRPQDITDAKTIIVKNPDLDETYVRHWLGQFAELVQSDLIAAWERMRGL